MRARRRRALGRRLLRTVYPQHQRTGSKRVNLEKTNQRDDYDPLGEVPVTRDIAGKAQRVDEFAHPTDRLNIHYKLDKL